MRASTSTEELARFTAFMIVTTLVLQYGERIIPRLLEVLIQRDVGRGLRELEELLALEAML